MGRESNMSASLNSNNNNNNRNEARTRHEAGTIHDENMSSSKQNQQGSTDNEAHIDGGRVNKAECKNDVNFSDVFVHSPSNTKYEIRSAETGHVTQTFTWQSGSVKSSCVDNQMTKLAVLRFHGVNFVDVYDLNRNQLIRTLAGVLPEPDEYWRCSSKVAFSNDGSKLAVYAWYMSESEDMHDSPMLTVWSTDNWSLLFKVCSKEFDYSASICFSHDDTLVLLGMDSALFVFDCSSGALTENKTFETSIDFVMASPLDAKLFLVAGDFEVSVWDHTNGLARLERFRVHPDDNANFYEYQEKGTRDICFGPNNTVLHLSGTGEFSVWDYRRLQKLRTLSVDGTRLLYNPTTNMVIISCDGIKYEEGNIAGNLLAVDATTFTVASAASIPASVSRLSCFAGTILM
jgi:hypothetical protein